MAGETGGSKGSERFVAGDSIRGIGVLCVFLVHAALAVSLPRGNFDLSIFGAADRVLLALDVSIIAFFALSGYLISRPFVKALVLGRPLRAPQYARRRLARIVPAYALLIVATLVLLGTGGAPASDVVIVSAFGQAWTDTTFELQLMQGWTLSVEMAFYMVLPLAAVVLAAALRPLRARSPELRASIVLVVLAGVTLASVYVAWMRQGVQESQLPLAHLWAFTPGIALAAIEPLALRDRLPRLTPALLLIGAIVGWAGLLLIDRDREDARILYLALGGCLPLAGALVLHWQGRAPWRPLDNRVLVWIGERSYGLYLCHSLVLAKTMTLTADLGVWTALAVLVAVALPVSVLVAAASWTFVEQHAIAWSHGRRPQRAPAVQPAPVVEPAAAAGALGTLTPSTAATPR